MIVSKILGPTLGGFIADVFGLKAPFIASTLTILLAIPFAMQLPELGREASERTLTDVLHEYRLLVQNRLYVILFGVSFLLSLLNWGFRSIVLPTYGKEVLTLSLAQIGLLSSVTSIMLFLEQFFVTGMMERYLNRRALVTLGLHIFSYSVDAQLPSLLTASAVLCFGLGILTPTLEAVWIDITRAGERGRIYGVRIAFFDLGQIAWSILITVLTHWSPLLPIYATTSIAISTAVLLHYVLKRHYRDLER